MALASFLDDDDYTHEIKGIRYPPIVSKDNLEAMANFDLRDDDIAIVTFPKAVPTSSSFGITESNTSPIAHPVGSTSVKQSITIAPRTTPLANPLPVLISSTCGTVGGIVMIGVIILAVCCKGKTRNPPSGQDSKVIVTVTNTTATGEADQALQGLKVEAHMHNKVLAALKQNPMYIGVGTPPKDSTSTSCHDQTGQGQSQTITKSDLNTTATVVTSDHDNQYEDIDNHHNQTGQGQSQNITESHTNTTDSVLTSGHDQTGQGQYQNITESHTNTTASVLTSGHDQTGQGQSQAITESHTNTTATATISGHDQTAQTQSQNTTQSFDVRNLAYNQGVSLSQQNRLYTGVESPPNNQTSEGAGPGKPVEIKTSGSPNQSKPLKDEPAPLPPPREGADTLQAVSESYVYEDVDSPLKSPKPRGTGVWPSAKNEALEKANKTKPTKEEPPPLPPPRRVDDALFAVSQPHLYEDVDAPPKSPIPTGAGPRNFAKNKTIVTGNKNKTVKDEPPPLPPPRKGDLTMPSVSQPHLYEDEDAPPKSPKPTGTGLRQIAKNKTIVTENKNISVKDEPPPLPPPRKGDLTMSSVSQPHLYEDVDAPPKSPKPTGTCRRQFTKNEAHGTGIKSNPTKEEPPPLPPPRKGSNWMLEIVNKILSAGGRTDASSDDMVGNLEFQYPYEPRPRHDLLKAVRTMAAFLQIKLDDASIETIAHACTFANMKSTLDNSRYLGMTVNARKGIVGDWKMMFTDKQSRLLNSKCKTKLEGTGLHCNFE
uniref:Sulfotransferase domain-containing protein n=1 Tax=Branchiostoma floridae TaxID=7739 RepID=C3XS39_BRAFL|eukprot:XP_002613498.1 hypothetical protein BRAFLDRAFT_71892 [Branchiostoma floridae]